MTEEFKTGWKIALFAIAVIVIITVIGWFMRVGEVRIEHEIVKNSHQYQESQKQQRNMYEVGLAEVDEQLLYVEDEQQRQRLLTKRKLLERQLKAVNN